jgi:hypothetical protein
MAEAKLELVVDKASSSTSKTTKNKARKPTGRKTSHKSGAEQLRCAADRQVGRNSKELADLMTKKALKGNLAYTKALVGFAEGKKPEPVKKRRGPTLAERLRAEKQWEGGDEEDRD